MTALLNAAHAALTHTAPIPEAAMFAAPWLVLLAWFARPIARGAFWLIHGGPDSYELGVTAGRAQAVDHLRATAQAHQGNVGDGRRRGALNAAADAGRGVMGEQAAEKGAVSPW